MKQLITKLVLIIIALGASSVVYADERPKEFLKNAELDHLLQPSKNRPRIPSLLKLDCFYEVGYITFNMPEQFEYIEVTLSIDENNPIWTGVVFKNSPETDIPELIGEYTITCQTDGNQIFTGLLTF